MKREQHLELFRLARTLVTPERFGDAAMQDTIEFTPIRLVEYPHRVDDPSNVIPVDFTEPPDLAA